MKRFRGDGPRPMPLSERLYRRFFLKYHGRYLLTDLQLRAKAASLVPPLPTLHPSVPAASLLTSGSLPAGTGCFIWYGKIIVRFAFIRPIRVIRI